MPDNADEKKARIERRLACYLEAARAKNLTVTSDQRVFADAAASLSGISHGYFKNLISEGRGPATFWLGGQRKKITVDLFDLAAWVETRRHD